MTGGMKRNKHTINYRNTDGDQELYEWIESKSQNGVLKSQDFIKKVMHDAMIKEKNEHDVNK